jgi:hypothetical protein
VVNALYFAGKNAYVFKIDAVYPKACSHRAKQSADGAFMLHNQKLTTMDKITIIYSVSGNIYMQKKITATLCFIFSANVCKYGRSNSTQWGGCWVVVM